MALLLDDLLHIARITQGKLRLKKEQVAFSDVMDEESGLPDIGLQ